MVGETIRCHYEVLGVERDADASTIKKAHRKLALKHHPDKNQGDETAADQFRLIQQAYELLSDPQERQWYDDHRDAILAGWSASGDSPAASAMLFEVVPYMHPGCYKGYHDEEGGFFQVYSEVFSQVVQCERKQSEVTIHLPTEFGDSQSDWSVVHSFYQAWESFGSQLNFAWEDKYNVFEDAPNRWVRRKMEDENKKARKVGKKTYNQDIWALVAFCKKRDPRVKAKQAQLAKEKVERARKQKEEAAARKLETQKAKEAWLEEAQREQEEAEAADRMAGRVRLADLEDDYDYGGGKKRGKKKKNKRKNNESFQEEELPPPPDPEATDDSAQAEAVGEEEGKDNASETPENPEDINEVGESDERTLDLEVTTEDGLDPPEEDDDMLLGEDDGLIIDDEEEESSSEEEPDAWWCECCKKEFKSEGQMENHVKSKKHKEKFKKYQAKIKKEEEAIMAEMLDEMALEP